MSTPTVVGTRRQIAFYGSTPAYRGVLEHHGWDELHPELNRLSKQGEWVKMGELIDDLAQRMEQASQQLEFERAARLRDQINGIKSIHSTQSVTRNATEDIDAVALVSHGSDHCVSIVFVRGGRNLGSSNFFPRPGIAEAGELLSGFLAQYYLGREAPGEIIVDSSVEDQDLLQAEMSERSGHQVRIRNRVRGDRQRWIEMARTNAEQGLSMEIASNATIRRQFTALGEALGFEGSPERLECFDISHTSGEATVASCVVFNLTGPVKSEYRRFNLSPGAAGDDYAAMREALHRRYARVKKGEVSMPDVLFVDGGKGQLSEAMTVLDELEIEGSRVSAAAERVG